MSREKIISPLLLSSALRESEIKKGENMKILMDIIDKNEEKIIF